MQKKISFAKDELVDPTELDEPIKIVFEEYEKRLKSQNAFDFDDLIEKLVRIFQKHQGILEKYQNKFKYLPVDKFQDINTSQYALIKLLAGKHKNLNVVGDDNQSIYGFRGTDFRNFLNFEKDWPEAKAMHLGENYRSTQNIVRAAAEVIKNNKLQRPKNLWTQNNEGNLIKVIAAKNTEDEARQVVNNLANSSEDKLNAILYRTQRSIPRLRTSFKF